ncbi:methionyl-tRNA formyltransferase [Roseospira marina]|uniref:Methionyl-tRNA formyltransferase n=1 Tax=Roseospira marina TaxID=140057 RepID=A0A5M6I7B9_9PROT|nr:formyltransferase family protein [Roseospira marina]KAA5603787.1 methionyl-tRNA formyltransferase [Roseospira marina]MBB4316085.1 methionyl-tRNA formyltransferase [Roseospira marina]MBB5089251.1 methionyl-tRNA formyltransferase [Roseospira marina]
MRIVVIGQKWLAATVAADLAAAGHDLHIIAPNAEDRLAVAAHALGVPLSLHGPGRRLDGTAIPPCDLAVAAHCHVFLPAEARAAARHGVIGYHPSLLPLHRGRDAVWWTIHNGDPVTGGTVYRMDDGYDTGPIVAQEWCFVRADDTPASLWRRDLAPMGQRMLGGVVARLGEGGALPETPQPELRPRLGPLEQPASLGG